MKKNFKNFKSEHIFKFAIALLPFENFFFAPSSGWATLTPIVLFIYMLLNYKFILKYMRKYLKYIMVAIGVLLLNIVICLFTNFNIINIINVLIPIALGITSLISFNIYYEKEKSIKPLGKLIFIVYTISLVIGIIQFIGIKFKLDFIYDIFDLIFKRNYYRNNRIQFFFTEPSFIGMHLFGVLLPFYFFTKNKEIRNLIIVFAITSIVFSSGVRILLDIAIVSLILLIGWLIRKRKFKYLFIIPLIGIISIVFMYNYNYRVQQIVDKGIYADGSLASRYFRIQASIYGYIEEPIQTLIGYGMGNSIIPLRNGYEQAKKEYRSSYVKEVNELGDSEYYDDSVSYCLYIRFISEFGLIIFAFVIYYLCKITKESNFKLKYEYLFITLYLYLQFESYAFYSLWIYILAMLHSRKGNKVSKKQLTNQ